jgi:signal peptidase I
MPDERVPPPPDQLTAGRPAEQVTNGRPPAREVVRAARAAPAAPAAKAGTTAAWLKTEAAHFAAALVLGALVFLAARLLGYDARIGGVAAVVTVLFGRSVTRLFLPEHDPEAAPNASPASAAAATQPDTVREIIETVVFVVVLVLLLKSFVAEAFVIPTGSMATTLWGYQKVVDCPECGYRFPVNSSSEADPQDGHPPVPVVGCTCPNCRYHIDFGVHGPADPGWSSGDRVLVAKFLYDLLGRQPERLDVVVFKFPGDSGPGMPWPQSGPYSHYHVPINYIKRLVGEPGEIIAVHGGNLYRIPRDQVPEEERKKFESDAEKAKQEGAKQLWQTDFTNTKLREEARQFFEKYRGLFQIIRKPPETMLAMRRIVYDNDHPARDLPGPEWERWAGGAWSPAGRGFAHAAGPGKSTDWLYYRHLLRSGGGKPQLITDFMGYNSAVLRDWGRGRESGVNWVNDLMVECEATVEKAEGTLALELSRGVDRFQARFDLSAGTCKLVRLTGTSEEVLDSKPTELKKPGTYRLRFADFDHRLTVWVDNALPFGDGVVFTLPADTGPRKENDLDRPVGIGTQGAAVRVVHLQTWRDTYYTVADQGGPGEADVPVHDFGDPSDWKQLSDLPVRTMDVQPGHYLCMGDNSPESSDGRTWGLVPDRLLLGRALLVYYPFNRGGRIR